MVKGVIKLWCESDICRALVNLPIVATQVPRVRGSEKFAVLPLWDIRLHTKKKGQAVPAPLHIINKSSIRRW
ncbi:MAG: hypothetical protein DRP47_09180 [Candidatus Zixiibacteriota bacterium]|nr:MAG: hypothetical protein DRP47_09180 [candidate division Zixibacteria bacterium]